MRVGNAYRIVGELKKTDKRYKKLISKIESKIEYQKRLSYGFGVPNINFAVRTKARLSKGEIKVLKTYLGDKYFGYSIIRREHKVLVEYKKRLFGGICIVKLI